MEQQMPTRGERRENKRRKRRSMGVSGSSVRRLQQIILDKSRKNARKRK